MSILFTGLRALGNLPPEQRSAMLKLARATKSLVAAQRRAALAQEESVTRLPGSTAQRSISQGGRATVITYGTDADKPTTQYLLERGTGAFIYVAQDTDTVYIWNGSEYKSAVFT